MEWITIGVLTFDALALAFVIIAAVGCYRGAKAEREGRLS